MLTCQMQIRTEAWKGSLPMLTGKGLYDQNLSRATLTRDAKFELIPLQLLRRRWTRLKDMNAVSLISPFDFQLIGLAEKHFSTPHICSQVFGLPR